MKIVHCKGFIAVLLLGVAQLVFGAPLPVRAPSSQSAPTAAAPPAEATRPAPPARMKPPYKPIQLSNPAVGLQQSTVQWVVPDQSDGRDIQQWVVRACPKVDGSPYAACQAVPGPAAGQASGATVQGQIPAHILYTGSQTPVIGAEICSANSAGISCADRIALSFPSPAVGPAPLQTVEPARGAGAGSQIRRVVPLGGVGIKKPATHGYFLRIPGVDGESTDSQHQGWIALLSATWQVRGPAAGRGAGAAGNTGRDGCQQVNLGVTKVTDKASPSLRLLASKGKRIALVTLDGPEASSQLHDVLISSMQQQGSDGDGKPRELISLDGLLCAQ